MSRFVVHGRYSLFPSNLETEWGLLVSANVYILVAVKYDLVSTLRRLHYVQCGHVEQRRVGKLMSLPYFFTKYQNCALNWRLEPSRVLVCLGFVFVADALEAW